MKNFKMWDNEFKTFFMKKYFKMFKNVYYSDVFAHPNYNEL